MKLTHHRQEEHTRKWGCVERDLQDVARALLYVVWGKESATKTAREAKYRGILKEDLEKASTGVEKDALTYGLFSLVENDREL